MNFSVADVTKARAPVMIRQQKNRVKFNEDSSYIETHARGNWSLRDQCVLERRGGQ